MRGPCRTGALDPPSKATGGAWKERTARSFQADVELHATVGVRRAALQHWRLAELRLPQLCPIVDPAISGMTCRIGICHAKHERVFSTICARRTGPDRKGAWNKPEPADRGVVSTCRGRADTLACGPVLERSLERARLANPARGRRCLPRRRCRCPQKSSALPVLMLFLGVSASSALVPRCPGALRRLGGATWSG